MVGVLVLEDVNFFEQEEDDVVVHVEGEMLSVADATKEGDADDDDDLEGDVE